MSKKLYVVTVTRRAYVLADSEIEAMDYDDLIDENEDPEIDCEVADSNVLRWFPVAEIYHAEQDDKKITVKEAFNL